MKFILNSQIILIISMVIIIDIIIDNNNKLYSKAILNKFKDVI